MELRNSKGGPKDCFEGGLWLIGGCDSSGFLGGA